MAKRLLRKRKPRRRLKNLLLWNRLRSIRLLLRLIRLPLRLIRLLLRPIRPLLRLSKPGALAKVAMGRSKERPICFGAIDVRARRRDIRGAP